MKKTELEKMKQKMHQDFEADAKNSYYGKGLDPDDEDEKQALMNALYNNMKAKQDQMDEDDTNSWEYLKALISNNTGVDLAGIKDWFIRNPNPPLSALQYVYNNHPEIGSFSLWLIALNSISDPKGIKLFNDYYIQNNINAYWLDTPNKAPNTYGLVDAIIQYFGEETVPNVGTKQNPLKVSVGGYKACQLLIANPVLLDKVVLPETINKFITKSVDDLDTNGNYIFVAMHRILNCSDDVFNKLSFNGMQKMLAYYCKASKERDTPFLNPLNPFLNKDLALERIQFFKKNGMLNEEQTLSLLVQIPFEKEKVQSLYQECSAAFIPKIENNFKSKFEKFKQTFGLAELPPPIGDKTHFLHKAVLNSNMDSLNLLLDMGFSANCKNNFGITPIQAFIASKEEAFCGFLHKSVYTVSQYEDAFIQLNKKGGDLLAYKDEQNIMTHIFGNSNTDDDKFKILQILAKNCEPQKFKLSYTQALSYAVSHDINISIEFRKKLNGLFEKADVDEIVQKKEYAQAPVRPKQLL